MTTRKLAARLALAMASAWLAFGAAGCATPGPLHVYSLANATAPEIRDDGPAPAAAVPSFLAPGDTVTGFAYDPFTDHFFLRLAPGNRIRVVDRPARAVKREFTAEKLPADGGGDLAVRPRDGHLFFVSPSEPALLETNRFGSFIRRIGLPSRAEGIAYDSEHDELIALDDSGRTAIRMDRDGNPRASVPLSQPVASGAFGYDPTRRELYAPLRDGGRVGVFDDRGQLLLTLSMTAPLLDVGPRSFLRVF